MYRVSVERLEEEHRKQDSGKAAGVDGIDKEKPTDGNWSRI